MPSQAGSPLETLPTRRTAERGGALLVDLLVVAEEPGQPESFPTRVADVLLPLRVDAHVVAQRHVVGVGFVAEVAPEVSRLVGVLVVQQGACMLVGTAAQVTGVWSLIGVQVHGASLHADVGGAVGRRGGRQVLGWAVMSSKFISRGKAFTAAITLKIHLGPGALWAFAQPSCSVGS